MLNHNRQHWVQCHSQFPLLKWAIFLFITSMASLVLWTNVKYLHLLSLSFSSTMMQDAMTMEPPLNNKYEFKGFETPFVVYNSLQYRRICAPIGSSSVVCMTIRYPWEVQPQDKNYSYPRPVDERFYNLDKKTAMVFVDGQHLDHCQQQSTQEGNIDQKVKYCLDTTVERVGTENKSSQATVAVAFFRESHTGKCNLFGIGYGQQRDNALKFFNGQVIQFYGDSIANAAIKGMRDIFGPPESKPCVDSPVERAGASFYCGGKQNNSATGKTGAPRIVGKASDSKGLWSAMDESYNIFMGFDATNHYRSPFRPNLALPHLKLHDRIKEMRMVHKGTNLRNLTIVVPYPIAHIQDQPMLINRWSELESRQGHFSKLVMAGLSEEGKETMRKLGWNLVRIIVFDGFPQFFPTPTSGYNGNPYNGKKSFIENGGYPGEGEFAWIPEHGDTCRGPVPQSSNLTAANKLSRDAFHDLGLDMDFYIRSWEFSNQFWWMAAGWTGKNGWNLDCTHGVGKFYHAHVYLLQAAIDDYYE